MEKSKNQKCVHVLDPLSDVPHSIYIYAAAMTLPNLNNTPAAPWNVVRNLCFRLVLKDKVVAYFFRETRFVHR